MLVRERLSFPQADTEPFTTLEISGTVFNAGGGGGVQRMYSTRAQLPQFEILGWFCTEAMPSMASISHRDTREGPFLGDRNSSDSSLA